MSVRVLDIKRVIIITNSRLASQQLTVSSHKMCLGAGENLELEK